MHVLAVDVGGTNVKILATGQEQPRKFSRVKVDAGDDGRRGQELAKVGSTTWYRSVIPGR